MSVSCFSQSKQTYVYAIKGADTLQMDVYTPNFIESQEEVSKPLPALIWMHGGGFMSGSKSNSSERKLATLAAQKGYVAILISYRLSRKNTATGFGCYCSKKDKIATFKMGIIDFLDAASYVSNNHKYFNVDPNRIIAGGSSAGAEVVLNAIYLKNYFLERPQIYNKLKFAGIVSLSGAVLNTRYITASNAIPTVLFHGVEDGLIPYKLGSHHRCNIKKPGYLLMEGSHNIAAKLKALEMSYFLYAVKYGKHEVSMFPFDQMDMIFNFFDQTVFDDKVIQYKQIVK